MIKLLQAIALAGLTLTMLGCASSRNTPQLNPQPKHFLTIKGYIAPELKGKVYLAFVQTYVASSRKCIKTTNWFEGIKGYPVKNNVYLPAPNINGNYKIHIPLDKYTGDDCQWVPLDVGFTVRHIKIKPIEKNVFADYYYHANKKNNPKEISLICKKTAASCKVQIKKNAMMPIFLDRMQSDIIKFNLIYKK